MNRAELRKKIPRGGIKRIAIEARVSPVSVSRYFNGDFCSHKIEVAALKIACMYKDEIESLEKKLYERFGNL